MMRIFLFLYICKIIASMTRPQGPHKMKLGERPFIEPIKSSPPNPVEGCDQRFPNEEIDDILLQSILDNFQRREIIAILQDNTKSVPYKLKVIENYRHLIYFCEPIPNILAAGLLDDWDFDFI